MAFTAYFALEKCPPQKKAKGIAIKWTRFSLLEIRSAIFPEIIVKGNISSLAPVLKVKNMPFRIHQTSAPKLPWSWSPNPPRSILWCSGTTSSTWSQKSMSKLSRNFCSDVSFWLFWLHVPGKCRQFVRTMLFKQPPSQESVRNLAESKGLYCLLSSKMGWEVMVFGSIKSPNVLFLLLCFFSKQQQGAISQFIWEFCN